MSDHALRVANLTKVFEAEGGPVRAVDSVGFEIEGSEFFTMLGPSGCGKTTTLRMIAGLESPTSGTIYFDATDYTRVAPSARNIGMVFQSYALFPHLSVFENVAYGLRIRRRPERDVKAKVEMILKTLGLDRMATRFPADLSGGQQQRVSIARALVYDPGMLLLDEPLANLDAKLRVEMREEIRRIQKALGIMALYVTHDQEEAMSVSDRVAVFNKGRLMQVGRPEEVYSRPRSLFVADFVGKANFFPADALAARRPSEDGGRPAAAPGEPAVQVALRDGAKIEVERHYRAEIDEVGRVPDGAKGLLMVRPEQIELMPQGGGPHACRVRRRQFLGSFVRYVAESDVAMGELLIDMRRPVEGIDENGAASFMLHRQEACFFQR